MIEPGGIGHEALVARFGPEVVGADGHLDRAALARQVFADPQALVDLTSISHPAANQAMADEVALLASDTVVVLDMAVLAEYPKLGRWPGGGYETVVVVEAPEVVRVGRLVEHRGMAEADARARIANQTGDDERRRLADHIVDNAEDQEALSEAVDQLWAQLIRRG